MVDVSVVLPCRNEEKTIEKCIKQIKDVFKQNNIKGEIIVSDSSIDSSFEIAKQNKVNIVKHKKVGYGIACILGANKAKGNVIIFGDSDGTYDFSEIPYLLDKIKTSDIVIGSRMKGNMEMGAMAPLHRYVGNPILSKLLNLFFGTNISDCHSGLRAIKKKAYDVLELRTSGMEFASEMIIRAAKKNMKISEVPISYSKRVGKSKLSSFSDGWRHLRFMLLLSPTYLYLIPGSIVFVLGIIMLFGMAFGEVFYDGMNLSSYIVLIGSFLTMLGYQIISLGLFSNIYAVHNGFEENDVIIDNIARWFPLERGIKIGLVISLTGFLWFLGDAFELFNLKYNSLSGVVIPLTLLIVGIQTVFSVFFVSMMLIEKL